MKFYVACAVILIALYLLYRAMLERVDRYCQRWCVDLDPAGPPPMRRESV